jgi:hypothetical protein
MSFDYRTADKHDLAVWLMDDTDEGGLRYWAYKHLRTRPIGELRAWVEDATCTDGPHILAQDVAP